MKNGAVVLGIFILVGIIAGAFIISSAGQEKRQVNDLNPVNDRIDGLALRMDSFERKISELDGKLEDYLSAIEAINVNIQELKGQLAAVGKENASGKDGDAAPADSSGGLRADKQEIIETLKDEVKKELKEETKIAQRKEKSAGVKKWADSQTQGLRKRMDKGFIQFAQKIRLDRNQEIAVKDITDDLINKVSTIWSNWENQLAEGMTDENWGDLKGELGEVYNNTKDQLLEHVTERQAGAIMGFIQDGGGK